MQFPSFRRRTSIAILVLAIVGIVAIVIFAVHENRKVPIAIKPETSNVTGVVHKVIGKSVEGRNIDAYTYGSGKNHLELVGGIHGGYEWNSVVLAYQVMDYLDANSSSVPSNLSVTVIPDLNPDGVFKVFKKDGRIASADLLPDVDAEPGRFNANIVDLNRNFDCKWQATSTWKNKTVSAGSAPFSEPEAKALRDFVAEDRPVAAVFWHSQSGAVYASKCQNGILSGTLNIMNLYATASGYPAVKDFTAYETTGGADDWLASIGIPALTVELTTHKVIEFQKNLAGVKALFEYYGNI